MLPRGALLVFVLPLVVAAAPQSVPEFDVVRSCRGRSVGEVSGQQGPDLCIKEERAARDEAVKLWPTVPAEVRERCAGEVRIGGSPSYVELVVCAQMSNWSKETPAAGETTRTGPATRR